MVPYLSALCLSPTRLWRSTWLYPRARLDAPSSSSATVRRTSHASSPSAKKTARTLSGWRTVRHMFGFTPPRAHLLLRDDRVPVLSGACRKVHGLQPRTFWSFVGLWKCAYLNPRSPAANVTTTSVTVAETRSTVKIRTHISLHPVRWLHFIRDCRLTFTPGYRCYSKLFDYVPVDDGWQPMEAFALI
jgi:hypothetical protein